MLAGRRHSISSAQGLQLYDGASSQKNPTSYTEKSLSPIVIEPKFGIGKGQRRVPSATTRKKCTKTLSFGDLSKRFDLSRAGGKPISSYAAGDDEFLFEGNTRQLADKPKVSSFPAHTTSSFRVIDGSAIEQGSLKIQLQMPKSVDKSAHHCCDSSTKEPSSPSSFDPCTGGEIFKFHRILLGPNCQIQTLCQSEPTATSIQSIDCNWVDVWFHLSNLSCKQCIL
jgi:hypothetical protein